eukprot:340140-Amphidinium_carterae.1
MDACLATLAGLLLRLAHVKGFRLVGGSIKSDPSTTCSTLECARFKEWLQVFARLRHVPVPWHEKCRILLSTQPVMTHAQGTHSLMTSTREFTHI